MKLFAQSLLIVHLLLVSSLSLFGQGSLTPPGAPAPTMRSLDQIEPRTPISTLPFIINSGGHYYLTKSISTTGDGVTIQADDVVVDLNGFTLSGDGGGTDAGVQTNGTHARIIIRNGTLRNFGTGCSLSANTSETLVEHLILSANTGNGLTATSNSSGGVTSCVLRRLRASENTGAGFSFTNAAFVGNGKNLIDQCVAVNNGTIGINISTSGNMMMRCLTSATARTTTSTSTIALGLSSPLRKTPASQREQRRRRHGHERSVCQYHLLARSPAREEFVFAFTSPRGSPAAVSVSANRFWARSRSIAIGPRPSSISSLWAPSPALGALRRDGAFRSIRCFRRRSFCASKRRCNERRRPKDPRYHPQRPSAFKNTRGLGRENARKRTLLPPYSIQQACSSYETYTRSCHRCRP